MTGAPIPINPKHLTAEEKSADESVRKNISELKPESGLVFGTVQLVNGVLYKFIYANTKVGILSVTIFDIPWENFREITYEDRFGKKVSIVTNIYNGQKGFAFGQKVPIDVNNLTP